jgi:hypothetical protein
LSVAIEESLFRSYKPGNCQNALHPERFIDFLEIKIDKNATHWNFAKGFTAVSQKTKLQTPK